MNRKKTCVNANHLVRRFLVTAILSIGLETFLSENVRNKVKQNKLHGPRYYTLGFHLWNQHDSTVLCLLRLFMSCRK